MSDLRAGVVSLILVAAVNGLVAMALASPRPAQNSESPSSVPLLQEHGGVLTVARGKVTVNGNEAIAGLTVLSDSLIATASDSRALVDLGPLGRVEIRESARVLLTFTRSDVNLKSQCDRTTVIATRGQVIVKQPKRDVILPGADRTYTGLVEVVTNSGTDFIIDCTGRRSSLSGPVKGILGVIGVSGTIAAGKALSRGEAAASSPIR